MSRSTSVHLRVVVMAIAVLYLVFAVTVLFSAIGGLAEGRRLVLNWMEDDGTLYPIPSIQGGEVLNLGLKLMMLSVVPIIFGLLHVLLSSWILIGVKLRSRGTCLFWLGVNAVGLVIQLIDCVYMEKVTVNDLVEMILGIFVRCVLMYLVALFVKKLKEERALQVSDKNQDDHIHECAV